MQVDAFKHKDTVRKLRMQAFARPHNGNDPSALFAASCSGITCPDALIRLVVSYDYGYHNCGWWKNSMYDECLHVSASIQAHRKGAAWKPLREPEKLPPAELAAWATAFFSDLHPDALSWLWHEGGFSGNKAVDHLRLFYSKIMRQPILPQGEVYRLVPYADGSSPDKVFGRCGV